MSLHDLTPAQLENARRMASHLLKIARNASEVVDEILIEINIDGKLIEYQLSIEDARRLSAELLDLARDVAGEDASAESGVAP